MSRLPHGSQPGLNVICGLHSFQQFTQEQFHLFSRMGKRFSPGRGRTIYASTSPAEACFLGAQQSSTLETMQHRVKGSRAQFVAVALQFLDHAKTEDVFLARVVEDVDANQA